MIALAFVALVRDQELTLPLSRVKPFAALQVANKQGGREQVGAAARAEILANELPMNHNRMCLPTGPVDTASSKEFTGGSLRNAQAGVTTAIKQVRVRKTLH